MVLDCLLDKYCCFHLLWYASDRSCFASLLVEDIFIPDKWFLSILVTTCVCVCVCVCGHYLQSGDPGIFDVRLANTEIAKYL